VDLDMLWELKPALSAIQHGLSVWRLWRYDAVIVVSAAHPIGAVARWRGHGVSRLLQRVIREVGTASHVLVVSLQEGAGTDEGLRNPASTSSRPGSHAAGEDGTPRVTSMNTSWTRRLVPMPWPSTSWAP
jgi:hypothetical protein